ncbi:hypothetical protein JCM10213v2_002702 [Rhodosporidiobolus nylandii]
MGECCVCGQETTQKCGACAEANFSLFFCSREHQKLIWAVHRASCGAAAVPFATLRLSDAELDALSEILRRPEGGGPSHADMIERALGLPAGSYEQQYLVSANHSDPMMQFTRMKYRGYLFRETHPLPRTPTTSPPTLQLNTKEDAANFASFFTQFLLCSAPPTADAEEGRLAHALNALSGVLLQGSHARGAVERGALSELARQTLAVVAHTLVLIGSSTDCLQPTRLLNLIGPAVSAEDTAYAGRGVLMHLVGLLRPLLSMNGPVEVLPIYSTEGAEQKKLQQIIVKPA